jgi:O-antigen/teichoic acid export membrane protein
LATDPKPAPLTASRTILRNTSIILTRRAANWLINLVLLLMVPRYLGDVGLGQLQFGQSFATSFSIALGFGMIQLLTRQIARRDKEAEAMLATAFTIRSVAAIVIMAVIAITVELSDIEGDARLVVYAASATMIILSMAGLARGTLVGLEDLRGPAFADTGSKLIAAIVGVIVLVTNHGVVGYSLVLVLGAAIHTGILMVLASRSFPIRIGFSKRHAKLLLIGGLPFALMSAVITLYSQVDSLMLRSISGEATVGWYAAAMRVIGMTEVFAAAIATSIVPTLARTHTTDREQGARLATRAIAGSAALLTPLAFVLAANSLRIIQALPIPPEFDNSAPILRILAISVPVTALLTVTGAIASSTDRQKAWAAALAFGLAVNIGFNAWMIPRFEDSSGNGGTGAALATLISEAVIMVIAFRFMAHEGVSVKTGINLLKVGAAAAVMAGIAWGGEWLGVHWIAWNIVALAVYGAAMFALGIVTKRDVRIAKQTVLGRLGR